MKVIELSKEEEAKKAKKAALKAKRSLLKDCSTHQSCDLCFASGCAWCLGERACVSDEAWMCQGEDDHVGRIGRVKGCPSVIDVGEEKEEEGEEAEVPAEKVVKQVGRVGGGEGKCEAAESGCFGQKICACEREPRRQCTCGEVGDSNGCCNCGCGLCDEMCAGAGDQDQGGLRDAEEGATQQRNASGIHQLTRDELLRVKVEMEVGADGEGEVKEGGEEYSEAEISKCEFVKEKAKIDALDDPYEALNMTDSATTAEIRRSYRKLSVLLHPDKHPQSLCGEEALKAFTSLVSAHELLSDPDRRAAFDMYGDDVEGFNTQWEYEASGRRNTKDFYRHSKHITNIDVKLWERLKGKKEQQGKEKIWIVEFYSPWCGACQSFTSSFKKLAESIAEHEPEETDDWYGVDLEVGAVNCEGNMVVCQNEFNIRKYPTVRLVSPSFGTQHELQVGGEAEMREAAYEVAAEWLWLFDRAKVEKTKSKEEFEEKVLNSEEFHIVLFLDGETCGPCRSAKTNALRLSAGLLEGGGSGVVSYVNCAGGSEMRRFCVDEVGIPQAPHAPQILGWGAGEKLEGFKGEVLYNANEVPPHAALRLIESIVRMSAKVEEGEGGVVGGLVGTGKRLVSRENNKTSPNASKPLEATPATVLPGTAILLFINCAYIFYKFKVYDLYNRDDASLIYKITGNTLGKIGTINFGLFLIPVSTFSPSLAALGLSQEIAYAFHRSAAILAVIEIVVHGIFHTLSYHITRKESMAEYGAPTFTQWTVWPAKICYGEDAEGPDYECHACSCYHTKANVVGFWSLLFMLVVCFTSTPQIRRNWYKVFYWCHVIFALPALLLMLMHWSGMIGYFIPSLIIWGLSKSLQVFESLSIVLQGGTKVLDNALVPNAKLAEITLPFAGSPFVPGQFVRLSLVTLGANLSIFEPSHPYTIASSPSTGFVKILYASDTKFGRRLCQLGNSDKRSSLVCRGYFGPNDRYDRIHAAAHSPPNNLEKGVLIVAGGVGVTPYLSILSQLVVDLPDGQKVNNVRFVLICRGTGLLEHLRDQLADYAEVGVRVSVYVTAQKDAGYLPVVNALRSNNGVILGVGGNKAKKIFDDGCGSVEVSPHPLMPGVARPSGAIKVFLSTVLTPLFWCVSFYFSLKVCYWYMSEVQEHHVVETRVWLPLALVAGWIGVGILMNVPFVKRALWGSHDSEQKVARQRNRSMSIERDLLRSSMRSVEELEGRPDLDLLLKGFKGDVYICGPEAMKESVRQSCGVKVCVGKDKKKRNWGPVIGRCGLRVWEEIFAW